MYWCYIERNEQQMNVKPKGFWNEIANTLAYSHQFYLTFPRFMLGKLTVNMARSTISDCRKVTLYLQINCLPTSV